MSSQSLETGTRIYEGWGRGDFTVGMAELAPDAVLVIGPEIPDAGEYLGVEGFRTYMRGFLQAWDSLTISAESYQEAGDVVLAKVRQTGTGKGSGIPVTLDYFHLWRLRAAAVIRLESILREERALEAFKGSKGES